MSDLIDRIRCHSLRSFVPMILVSLTILTGSVAMAAEEITPEEIDQFAEKLVNAVDESDIGAFNDLIDWNGILKEVCRLPESDKLDNTRKEFKVEFRKATKSKESICGAIINTVEVGGLYTMVHSGKEEGSGNEEGRPFALFRLILPDNGGVNFHKYYLIRSSDDSVVAADMYIYLSAEPLTEIFRRGWAPLASQILSKSEDDNESTEAYLQNVENMGEFFELVNHEKNEDALKLYAELPEETRKEKTVLIARMRASQQISPEEYAKAIDDIKKYHPDDPSLDFLFIDGYLLQDKYEEALQCIDKTRESVGGDAYLTIMRANVLTKMEKYEEAIAALKEAEMEEPDLHSVYSLGLDICLAAKDYDLTAAYLTKLEQDFDYTWKDLTTVDVFKDFTMSPQFQEWLKREKP